MAAPPPKKTVTREDAPGAPEWVDRLVAPINAFMMPTAAALARGLTFRENFSGEVKTVEVTPPEDWELAPLGTGWAYHGDPAFSGGSAYVRKGITGEVETRGLVRRTSGSATLIVPYANPGTYTPGSGNAQFRPTRANDADASVVIEPIGIYFRTGSAASWVSLDGLRWQAADRRPPRWATPVDVRLGTEQTPFPGRPGAVFLLDARQKGAVGTPVVVTGLDWGAINLEKQRNAPGVRLHRVWGLSPGITYTLRLLILPE